MTAVKPSDVEQLLRQGPGPDIALVLVYGADIGLVAERAATLVQTLNRGSDDPFGVVRLDGDVLASDPARLADEAGTIGLFGGTRTVHVRLGHRNATASLETLFAVGEGSSKIVVEGGDLNRSSPVRILCERSSRALTIACYPDDERALSALIERTLMQDGLRIEPEARDMLLQSLGADRRASLAEIGKLALYVRGRTTVTFDDVDAVVSDVGASMLNTLIDAAFAGSSAAVEKDYRRSRHEGLDAAVVLGAASRHASALLTAQLGHPNKSPSHIVANWRGLHFKRKTIIERHLAWWRPDALRAVIIKLHGAVLDCRRGNPELAHARASAQLFDIARGNR